MDGRRKNHSFPMQGIALVVVVMIVCLSTMIFWSSEKINQKKEYHTPLFKSVMKGTETSVSFEMSSETSWNECHIIPQKVNSCNNLPNYFLDEDNRKEYQNAVINFWHIQKTGGSSMRDCLEEMYKQLNLPKPFTGMAMCGSMTKLLNNDTFLRRKTYSPIVLGHYTLGMCDLIREEIVDRKCSAFTIFRDPYDRAVSHYYHNREKARKRSQLRSEFDLPVTEWVKKFGSVTWRSFFKNWKIERKENGMTCSKRRSNRSTTGKGQKWPKNEFLINDILNNFDKHVSFVGLFDDRPTTYKMLQEIYNLPFYDLCLKMHSNDGFYDGVNVSVKEALKRESKRALMEDKEIKNLMKFDILLYEKGKTIFEAQKKEFEAMHRRKLGR